MTALLRIFAFATLLAAASLASHADAGMRTLQLNIGRHALKVEVAENDAQRMKGLMFREKMAANSGMLFIFEEPAYQSMWMKNTLIPLSVAFVDRDGVILNIPDMQPQTLDTHMSAGPALYAIETNKGWFAERGIKPGDRVSGLPRVK
jgi:uncharacterized protein